jgi:glycosyltransferase involved in cell wall biosynthesis
MTKIIAGCPVRNRGWALPQWFEGLRAQDHDLEILCLASESEDNTIELLKENGATVLFDPQPGRPTAAIDGHYWGTMADYEYMARIRNLLLEDVISHDADYFLSIDSDIVLPPGALEKMIEINIGVRAWTPYGAVVSPYVNMGQTEVVPNVMSWAGSGNANRDFIRSDGGYADVIMACMLFDRHAMAQLRWSAHQQGEDVGLCIDATIKQVPRWWEPSIRCDHLMRRY